jgi:hypothetical protein
MVNYHPLQRLKFKKGQVTNPKGGHPISKKREWTVKGMIEEAMDDIDKNTGLLARKLVYERLVKMAKQGDIMAIKEINNRLDGTPELHADITSAGEPIEFNIDAVIGLSQTPAKAAISGPDDVRSGV